MPIEQLETVNLFTTVADNAGEAWETSSVIKENDGVSAPPSYMFFFYGFTYLSVNSDWLKSLTNKENIGILI